MGRPAQYFMSTLVILTLLLSIWLLAQSMYLQGKADGKTACEYEVST